jgi:lambda family phage portal protein
MNLVKSIAARLGHVFRPQAAPPKLSRGPRMRRNYDAGSQSRLTADFPGSTVSADTDLVRQLRVMRGRSRTLFKNEPYMRRYVRLGEKNVAGPAGVQLTVLGGDDEENPTRLNRKEALVIERRWKAWAKSPWVCADGRTNWPRAQRRAMRNACIDGEVFVRFVSDSANPWLLALDWIVPDRMDEQFNSSLGGGGEMRLAIEFDGRGRRVAYHPFRRDPVDYLPGSQRRGLGERMRIPSEEMVHWYLDDFVGQTRGVPWMFAAIPRVNMMGGYEEAELVASRVAASKMGFIVMPEGQEYEGDAHDEAGNTITEAQPGTFEELPHGTELKEFDPQHPNSNFAAFSKCMLRGIAAAGDVSYHTLSGDLESVNYSSARVGLLDERDGYEMLQDEFVGGFCQPIFRAWLMAQALLGEIPLSFEEARDFDEVIWRPRRWAWIDPQKEIGGAAQAVALRVKSRMQIVAEQGGEWEQTRRELCTEEDKLVECGLTPMGPVANVLQVGVSRPPKGSPKEGSEEVEADDTEQLETEEPPKRNGQLKSRTLF